jgi:hypothetical protein
LVIDGADLVQNLAETVVVGETLAGLALIVLGEVIHLRLPAIVTDREVVLGAMTATASALASRLAAGLVALDEGAPQKTTEGRQVAQELSAASTQRDRSLFARLGAHESQTMYITGLLVKQFDSLVNLLWVTLLMTWS